MLSNAVWGATGGFLCAASAGALAFFCVPYVQSKVLPKPMETKLSDILQFDSILEDEETLFTKDGQRVKVIELKGLQQSSKTDQEVQSLIRQNQAWLDNLIESGTRFKIITTRRKIASSMEGSYDQPLLQRIHDSWMEGFKETYEVRHYLILTSAIDKSVKNRLKSLSEKSNKANLADTLSKSYATLNDLVEITLDYLSAYQPVVLNNRGDFSPLLGFYGSLLSREMRKVRPYKDRLSEKLVDTALEFKGFEGRIDYDSYPERFESLISVKAWGEESRASILKDILALPGEITILHMIKGIPRYKAGPLLKYKKAQQMSLQGKDELDAALEIVAAEEASLCDYQVSLFVMAETFQKLSSLLQSIKNILRDYGIEHTIEKDALEYIWRCQFPGFDSMSRPTQLLSHNLSPFFAFEFTPQGLANSDWGKGPIRYFKTLSGSTYAFQFHVSEEKEALGHCVMVAPTGKGKTTLVQHLIAGAMRRPNFKAYAFDRFNGMKIFTESIGGAHIDLSSGQIPLNPLACEDTIPNRQFLNLFLKNLSAVDDTIENRNFISTVVDMIFKLPLEDRTLNAVFDTVFKFDSRLKQGLYDWVEGGSSAHWFNGTRLNEKGQIEAFDALNFDSSRLVTFEMEQIQQSPHLSGVMNDYIFHKIRAATLERSFPHFIFIDEAAKQLANKDFQSETKNQLSQIRKLQGVMCLAFQRIQQIKDIGLASSVREECPTAFLFQNEGARDEDYALFNVTESEMAWIRGKSRMAREFKHSVLIKRRHESVILDVNLSSLGACLKLYKSGNEAVQLVKRLKRQFGGEQWVEEYLKSA